MIRYMHPHIFSLHSEKGLIIPFGNDPETDEKSTSASKSSATKAKYTYIQHPNVEHCKVFEWSAVFKYRILY